MKAIRLCSAAALLAFAACPFEREAAPETEPPLGAPVTSGAGDWPLVYVSSGHPVSATTSVAATIQFETEVETLTNNYRVGAGLGALVADASLENLARAHSEHMIIDAFFDHQNPEGDWPTHRARSAGIPFAGIGENIAAGQSTAIQVFNDWLASPPHKENLDNPAWTHQGAGYAYTGAGTWNHYWSHNFRHE